MQDLPIGMSEFSEIRKYNCLYVDKTKYIYSLLSKNRRTFLSRPRRFGKSLFLSTLESALKEERDLFRGLWIESSDYAWKSYGVIRLDFSELAASSVADFKEKFRLILLKSAEKNNIILEKTDNPDALFIQLISRLYNVSEEVKRPVALLIDEYDSPILHALHDPELAKAFREVIKSFSLIAKANQKEIQFVFVTGVSAFSKSGLSSGLNNLDNLTMSEEFFSVCGYTDQEVDFYFKEYMQNWAEVKQIPYNTLRNDLKTWYNGYLFKENTPTVYSPYTFTLAVRKQELQNFWFESATPQFLLEEISKLERKGECDILHLDKLPAAADLLQTFEIEYVPLTALLFQMGYLTLDTYDSEFRLYSLKYPNLEVKTSLHKHLVIALTKAKRESFDLLTQAVGRALQQQNLEEFISQIKTVFAAIPYQLYTNSDAESLYHAVLQSLFVAMGLRSHAEYSVNQGRADIILELSSVIYVFEIKVNETSEIALRQIETRKYYEPFLHCGKPVCAVGLGFTRRKSKGKKGVEFSISYALKKIC